MADAELRVEIQALNQASPEVRRFLQDWQGAVQVIGQGGQQVVQQTASVGREIAQATRTARVFSSALLSELHPALGQVVFTMSAAASATRGMGGAITALSVGLAAGVVGFSAYLNALTQASREQAALNLAVREFDVSGLRGQTRQAIAELETMRERAKSVVGTFANIVQEGIRGLLGQPTIPQQAAQRLTAQAEVQRLVELPQLTQEARLKILQALQPAAQLQLQLVTTEEQLNAALREQIGLLEGVRRAQEALIELEFQRGVAAAKTTEDIAAAFGREAAARQALGIYIETQRRQLEVGARELRLRLIPPSLFLPAEGGEFIGVPTPEEAAAFGARTRRELMEAGVLPGPGLEALSPAERRRFEAQQAVLRAEFEAGGGEFVGVPAPDEAAALRREVDELRRAREISVPGRARVEILGALAGLPDLTAAQREAIASQRIETERLLRLEEARGRIGQDLLETQINGVAAIEQYAIASQRAAREDPVAGLRQGLQDVTEEFTHFGDLFREGVHSMAQEGASSFRGEFVRVLEGDFGRLLRLPDLFRRAMLNAIADIAAKATIGQISQGLRGLPGFGAFVPGLAGAGAAIPVTAQQAQVLAAQGFQIGAGSTGGLVAIPPAGAGGGGLGFGQIPISNLSLLTGAGGAGAGASIAEQALLAGDLGAGALGGAGGAASLGFAQVLGGLGGVLGLGLTVFSALQGPPTVMNIATSAVSGAISGAIIGSAFPGIGTAIGAIVGGLIGGGAGAFGKGGRVTKKQREAAEAGRATGAAQGMIQQINAVRSVEELHRILTFWGSGYTGGGSSLAIIVSHRGRSIGTTAAVIPGTITDPVEMFDLFRTDPEGIAASVQAGVNPALLQDANRAVEAAVREKVLELVGAVGQVGVFAEEVLPGGILRRTMVPGSQAGRLRGRALGIEAETLPEKDREALLRSLLLYDDDRSLRIVRRDPDTGYVVSITNFR